MSDTKPYWESYQNEPTVAFLVKFLKHPERASQVYRAFDFPTLVYAQSYAEKIHLGYFNYHLKVEQGRPATTLHITTAIKSLQSALDGLLAHQRLIFLAILLDTINQWFVQRDAVQDHMGYAEGFDQAPPYLKDIFALPPVESLLAHKDHAMILADTVDQLYECSLDGELGLALQSDFVKAIETELLEVPKRVRQKVADQTATFKEELMMICWHPDRVMKHLELGILPEDM
jgi:hypothetical protein